VLIALIRVPAKPGVDFGHGGLLSINLASLERLASAPKMCKKKSIKIILSQPYQNTAARQFGGGQVFPCWRMSHAHITAFEIEGANIGRRSS
jgi:hypothetical protein